MSIWDWLLGKGKHVVRHGPAHSSDRHGFWKDLWKIRKALNIDPAHSGSVDVYDHFGCSPYNDNDVKRERRDMCRPMVMTLAASSDPEKNLPAQQLLIKFDEADTAKRWRDE